MAEPRVAGRLVDRERHVTHPQARVAAVLAVRRGAAPVLDEEHGQAGFRPGEVGGVHGPEELVVLHPFVERLDQFGEEVTAHDIVDARRSVRVAHPENATVAVMSAYLIINYRITDPDLYGEYFQLAGPALKIGSECEVLVADPASTRIEGDTAGHQTIVLKFESAERAREIYESGEYQAALPKRLAATTDHFAVLAAGLD